MTATPPGAADLAADDEIRILAEVAANLCPVADLAVLTAELRARTTAEQDDDRAAAVARLAKDLQRAIDTSPLGWVLLVAELSLRAAEQRSRSLP